MIGTEFFIELAKELKPLGYRCFLYDKDTSNWLSIITPDDSWLEIFHGDFGGYNITYEYVPSRDFGTGCRCNENALGEITHEVLQNALRYGKSFSSNTWHNEYLRDSQGGTHKVRVTGKKQPKHYESGLDALMKSWCWETYMEI